jgi:enediyne biosynthesis protein E4
MIGRGWRLPPTAGFGLAIAGSLLIAASPGRPEGLRHAAAGAGTPFDLRLVDVTADSGVDFTHENSPTTQKYLIETMSGGVAMLDYDNDGWLDLFFTNGAQLSDPMPAAARPRKTERFANRLYRNRRDGRFVDVTQAANVGAVPSGGYSMGVAVGDYDNDGFADLYVTGYDSNTLYHNDGGGRFDDVTQRAGVAGGGWSVSAVFFDFDKDGWLDLFVTRYVDWSFSRNVYCGEKRPGYREYCHPSTFPTIANILYRSNRDGTFTDVSDSTRISAFKGRALGAAVTDYDGDGWLDVYVANDAVPGFLFRNERGHAFAETAGAAGVAVNGNGRAVAGMGVDFGDYDNDGRPDLFVTALSNETYPLYHNDGQGVFSDATTEAGVAVASLPYAGWGVRWIDLDNDGWKDLFVAQGHVLDTIELTSEHLRYLQPPLVLRNVGGRFLASPAIVPTGSLWAGRGTAVGDVDNDGDIDVLVATCGGPPHLLRNDGGNRRNWLSLSIGGGPTNRDAIGAEVIVTTDSGGRQHFVVTTGSSYLSASDKRIHVGLGPDRVARSIQVKWPSGTLRTLRDVGANTSMTIRE